MLTKLISELAAGIPSRTAEIPVNIAGVTCKLKIEDLLRLATPADSGAAAASHGLLAHVVAGLTNGHVLVATGPATFEFRRLTEFHLPNPADIDVKGNAATASRLLNPSQIAGVVFDGSGAIAIPHGNLEDAGEHTHAVIDAHLEAVGNPHRTTAEQIEAVPVAQLGHVLVDAQDATPARLAQKIMAGTGVAISFEAVDGIPEANAPACRLLVISIAAHAHASPSDGGQLAHTALTGVGANSHAQLDAHLAHTGNPHNVTAAQVGAAPAGHGHAYASLTNRPAFFAIIAVAGQTSIAADVEADTLTLVAGSGIAITTDPTTGTVTITNNGGGIPGAHGHTGPADGGTVSHTALTGVDTDTATSAIHHTLGAGANQAAPGNHGHAYLPLAGGALTGALTIMGGTAWHSGNDGPGSGLDADTVDGRHADELGSTALRIVMAQQFGGF
ncbi:MAG TPA: hypothetical protein PKC79_02055 [Solidesulfovibrio magneticus]|nr:hypothetical protein [Solidesulfovibrio magneticus]